jgi:hypothetical protein
MTVFRRPAATALTLILATCLAGGRVASAQIYQLYAEKVADPEEGDFTVNRLLTDRLMFSFVQLPDWELRREGTNRSLLFTAADLSAGIRFKLTEDTNGALARVDAPRLREEVLARLPESRLVQEFACFADGQRGVAFDLVRTAQHSTQAVFRVAFVPFSEGMAEFELRTTTNHMDRAHRVLRLLMNSFRVEPVPGGK